MNDDDDSGGWQHQMALDQEYRELDEAVDVVVRGLRQRGFLSMASQTELELQTLFGIRK